MEVEITFTARITNSIYVDVESLEEGKEIAKQRAIKSLERFNFMVEEIEEVDVCESI